MADKEEYQALLEAYKQHINFDNLTEGARLQFWTDIKMCSSERIKYDMGGLKKYIHTIEPLEVFDNLVNKSKNKSTTHELTPQIYILLLKKKKGQATELVVDYILTNEKIYTTRSDENSEMWIYKEGIYLPQARTYIQEICREILGDIYTTSIYNQIVSKIEADTFINQDEFFEEEDLNLIAVENGILNLNTKELTLFDSKYRFFAKLPIKYDKSKDCKKIKAFFESLFKDKQEIEVVQEIFGYLLHKDYFLEKAFMFLGTGRNGKGKTISLMKEFIGIDNCSEVPLDDLEKDIFALGELFKKQANLCGDLSKTALKNTGNFKKLTGRDLLSANRKFLPRVKFVNYAKMVFSCNELPITYDLTTAFFNRWIILDFPYTFLPQHEINEIPKGEKENIKLCDPSIIKRISTPDEMSGLLNWALIGLEKIIKDKSFSYSPSTEETKTKWLRKSDSCTAFLMDCVEFDYKSYISKKVFRKEYYLYCSIHKLKCSSDKTIKYILNTMLGSMDDRETIDGNQISVWSNIKLKLISEGSEGSDGIQPLGKNIKFSIGSKQVSNLTTLTNHIGNSESDVKNNSKSSNGNVGKTPKIDVEEVI